MKLHTNFEEHFKWGLYTGLAYQQIDDIFLGIKFNFKSFVFYKFFKIVAIKMTFLLSYILGSIQPDLDLCYSFRYWPRIKKWWTALALIISISMYFTELNTLKEFLVLKFLIITGTNLSAILWLGIISSINFIFRTHFSSQHRDSILHSSLIWGGINFYILYILRTQIFIGSITIKLILLHKLSTGVLQHLLLDSIGSITTCVSVKHKFYYIFYTILLCVALAYSGCIYYTLEFVIDLR